MAIINEPERSEFYQKVRHLLGAPLRSVELEDEMMDTLLEYSIDDYSQYVQDWLTESQWTSLYNLNLDTQSLSRAFVSKSLDFETRYTYAYSKIVGLQAGGDWVIKKDFVQLVPNQQIYEIPAGREINEILWFTPSTLNTAMFGVGGFAGVGEGTGLGGGGGLAQIGNMAGSYYLTPAFDTLLRMQEVNIQRRMFAGELTYYITALPGGKKGLHLLNTPGGRFDFGNAEMSNHQVWYWYYDTTDGDRDKCLADNPDIVLLPSDVPFDKLSWYKLNNPAQVWVRRWFTAYCKETLARVRGKFSGSLKTPDGDLTMDYAALATEGKDEKTKLIEALLAENLNKQLKYRAMPRQIYVI